MEMSHILFSEKIHYSNREDEFKTVYSLLENYGFRISEILNLSLESLVEPNKIIIKLAKCKDYFVFSDTEKFKILKFIFSQNFDNKFSINYFEFYRWFVKYHSNDIIAEVGKNAKITHSFRYRQAQNFKDCLKNEKQIQALLRHKSKTTQKYYLKK